MRTRCNAGPARTPRLSALSAILAVAAAGCGGVDDIRVTEREPAAHTHLRFQNDPRDFQFAIVGDNQGLARPGVFESAVRRINLLRPEFVMSIGDLVTGYVWEPQVARVDTAELEARWRTFDAVTAGLEMPFFRVPGNNDLNSDTALDVWNRRHGTPYYSFVYRDVQLIVLDSDDPPASPDIVSGPGGMGAAQIAWLRATLDEAPEARWRLLFVHRPMWLYDDLRPTWDRVREILGQRPYTVFAGHQHVYRKEVVGGRHHYMLATTGGMSDLRGPEHGEFDHVMWVTMTDDGPVVANIMLEGLWGDDPVTEAADRSVPES